MSKWIFQGGTSQAEERLRPEAETCPTLAAEGSTVREGQGWSQTGTESRADSSHTLCIVQGLCFYSEKDEKPMEDFEQRTDI